MTTVADGEAHIAAEVVAARRNGRRLRIVGGGTSAVVPRDGASALATSSLAGIVTLRPADGVVTVRVGTRLRDLDAALRAAGRRLPMRCHDPAGTATIGGAVAAASDGLAAREGFRWRDVVLGARAVLGTGERVRVGASVVKSVAGFDVVRLLVGSRGTLAVITCLDIRIDSLPDRVAAWTTTLCDASHGPRIVASSDALGGCVRGLVLSARDDGPGADADVILEGPPGAVEAAGRALANVGLRRVEDAGARWDALTARASAPSPAGLVRRVGRIARHDPAAFLRMADPTPDGAIGVARSGAQRAGGWVADVLRSRVTWIDISPPAAAAPESEALFRRVQRAFDPDGVFQAGRGYGHP